MSASAWLASVDAIAPAFIDAALRGAAVLLVALAISHALRKRTAAARHLVWVGAIAIQLALPLFSVWGPQWKLAIPGSIASVLPVELPTSATIADAGNADAHLPSREQAGPPPGSGRQVAERPRDSVPSSAPVRVDAVQPRISERSLLLVIWVAGALLILARLAIGTSIVATLARRGARVDDGDWLSLAQRTSAALHIDRPLTLLRGDRLGVPVTWGIVYPVVLLPDDADNWTVERRRLVLVHEMAHVKRLDALTQLAGQLALALFWFDPLVWIANRRMQLEREHACDDYVLRHGTAPSMYAEELLSMVRALGTPDHRAAQPAFAALAMARRSEFEGRMLSILDPVLDRHPLSKGQTVVSAFAALLLVVPLAALHPYQRAAEAKTVSALSAGTSQQTPAAKPADMAGDRRESFKVNIQPAPPASGMAARTSSIPAPASSTPALASSAPAPGLAAPASTKSPSCDDIDFGRVSSVPSTSIHADVSDGASLISYTKFNRERCSSATIIGRLTYTDTEDDVTGMSFGSHAAFRVRTPTDDRALTIVRSQDGALQHVYRLNGQSADYDTAARRWFATYLPMVLMETGVNIGPRVERWRAQGGVAGVLDHIATMGSPSAKRAHYESLLSAEKLSGDDLDRVVRSASENLRGSSSDMRAILSRAVPNARLSRQGASALESAIASMSSPGDKAAVLQMYGQTDDREMLLSVMRVAQTINSAGDKSRLLQILAARYLSTTDHALQDAFFDVMEHIGSPGDMRNTLMIAIPYGARSADVTRHIIRATRAVGSPGDQSQVLIALVSSGVVNTKELRDTFLAAAGEVQSEADRTRVLQAAASLRP